MTGTNPFGATSTNRGAKKSGSSGRSKPSISLQKPNEALARFLISGVVYNDGYMGLPVFAEDAPSVEDIKDGVEDDDILAMYEAFPDYVETLSFEDLFDVDLESKGIKFVGTPPLLNQGEKGEFEELPEDVKEQYYDDQIYSYGDPENGLKKYIIKPDWIEAEHNDELDDDVIYDASTLINGHYFYMVWDMFAPDEGGFRFSTGFGRNKDHMDEDGEVDEFAKRREVSFRREAGKSSADAVAKAMNNVGVLSDEQFDDWEDGKLDLSDLQQISREAAEE